MSDQNKAPDQNKKLSQAEQKLEEAAGKLEQAAESLRADQIVQAIVDADVPDLAPDAQLSTPKDAPAGTLEEELSALRANAERTKLDERIVEAES